MLTQQELARKTEPRLQRLPVSLGRIRLPQLNPNYEGAIMDYGVGKGRASKCNRALAPLGQSSSAS